MAQFLNDLLNKLLDILSKFTGAARVKALTDLLNQAYVLGGVIGAAMALCLIAIYFSLFLSGTMPGPKAHKAPPKSTEEVTAISIDVPLLVPTATITPTPTVKLPPPVIQPELAYCSQGWFPNTGCACCGTTEVCSDKTVTNHSPDCSKKGGGSSGGAPGGVTLK